MNKQTIQALHKYDLARAKVGDKVLGLGLVLEPGEVLALWGKEVVFGWQIDKVESVTSCRRDHSEEIYLAPLCWVEEKPVYVGDILYTTGHGYSHPCKVKGMQGDLVEYVRRGIDLRDEVSAMSWAKPSIKINGYEVPAPEREPLDNGTGYFFSCFPDKELVGFYSWQGDGLDHQLLNAGIIHLTRDAARAHAEALLSFTRVQK